MYKQKRYNAAAVEKESRERRDSEKARLSASRSLPLPVSLIIGKPRVGDTHILIYTHICVPKREGERERERERERKWVAYQGCRIFS